MIKTQNLKSKSNAYQNDYRIQIAGIFMNTELNSHYENEKTYIDNAYQFSIERRHPAAPSDTATLLRLHPNHLSHLRRLAPKVTPPTSGVTNSWCDGRCVQGPGTYSPRHADPRLLAIPASCRRVALQSELRTVL